MLNGCVSSCQTVVNGGPPTSPQWTSAAPTSPTTMIAVDSNGPAAAAGYSPPLYYQVAYTVVRINFVANAPVFIALWETHPRPTERRLPYGITRCYVPPDTGQRAPASSLLQTSRPLSLPIPEGCKAELTLVLIIYQDSLPVCRQSVIQVVTGS